MGVAGARLQGLPIALDAVWQGISGSDARTSAVKRPRIAWRSSSSLAHAAASSFAATKAWYRFNATQGCFCTIDRRTTTPWFMGKIPIF
jgi:hypothetical protein